MGECPYFDRGECSSCAGLKLAQEEERRSKEKIVNSSLPLISAPTRLGRRFRAKWVASHDEFGIRLGHINHDKKFQAIEACPQHCNLIQKVTASLPELFLRHRIPNYEITSGKGELKLVLMSSNWSESELMVRFVCRSKESKERLLKLALELKEKHPEVVTASMNIQPVAMAALEGREEIILIGEGEVSEQLAGVNLYYGPKSFTQVNPWVADKLYARAREVADELGSRKILDLYCGVGGFSHAIANASRDVLGIEISSDAVLLAKKGGEGHAHFEVGDLAAAFENTGDFDLIVVNPPRRGLDAETIRFLTTKKAPALLYSSCNPETLARDIEQLKEHYALDWQQGFDMFPGTEHLEILALLKLR
jgi:23S rRNA (uracil747-C5)-methyltransferase